MVSQFNLISHYFLSKHTNITGCLANMHGSTLCFSNKYKRFVLWAFVTVKLRVSSWLENGTMDQNTRKNTILPISSCILLSILLHWSNEWFPQKKDNNSKQKGRGQSSWTTYIYNLLGTTFQSFRIFGLQIELSQCNLREWFSQWNLGSTIR